MKRYLMILFLFMLLLISCNRVPGVAQIQPQDANPGDEEDLQGLSANEAATLNSLELVDPYPLYVMHYTGSYSQLRTVWDQTPQFEAPQVSWACTLFTALADADQRVYGRNFDWEYSPALLLYTDPPDGYASVSMVDIAYLGFPGSLANDLDQRPITELTALLDAPWWTFDGMNEHGLVVGMAAVPSGNMAEDPEKPTIGSLEVIRKMLDGARNVEEALEILSSYNIDMRGGPDLHYLIADRSGAAVLVEFYGGEMRVMPNYQPWHLATNFLCAAARSSLEGNCWRYDHVLAALQSSAGMLDPDAAMALLGDVSQANTQWSVVYGISTGTVNIAINRQYDQAHTFYLPQAQP